MSETPLVTPRNNCSGPLLVICVRDLRYASLKRNHKELEIKCEKKWAGRFEYGYKIPRGLHQEHREAAYNALKAFKELNLFNLDDLPNGHIVWRYDIRAYKRKLRRLRKERNLVQNAQAVPRKRQGILVPSTSIEDLARTGSLHQADHQPPCPPDQPHGPA